jgi:REP element-mobilizing transposase RayT
MPTPIPFAYFITFTCYGARLHGDEAGSADRNHNIPGTPYLAPNKSKSLFKARLMKQAPYELNLQRRDTVLQAIRDLCLRRGWKLLAAHVRSNHVHFVVSAQVVPERVMRDAKVQASRALDRTGVAGLAPRRWTRHGSTRYLWKAEDARSAVHYVLREQGEPMAVWENPTGIG